MKRLFFSLVFLTTNATAFDAPYVVGVPVADAGRGLVRINEQEIRSYPGKGGSHFLQSLDNGLTWQEQPLPDSYPDATCLAKESPSITHVPGTSEFFRVEPLYRKKPDEGIYLSEGGIDGKWNRILDGENKPVLVGGILRTPVWVNDGKRIVLPGHGGGCWTWFSDDSGKTWTRSNKINSPPHEVGGVHHGTRWNHGMVEATIVELNDKRLWMIARTAQDQHYESYSSDYGETWSEATPSRFWGTITMPTIKRLHDGRLLFLWSNTSSLPEVKREKRGGGEDVFTNRDALHAAISEDDGKTWAGFREVILDEHRNNQDYAITKGSNDRGKHQSEIIQLDANRVLLSCGQHPLHRKLMIMDLRWLYEKERHSTLNTDGSRDWSTHQYINKIAGHCGYNRKPGAQIVDGALRILRIDDPTLTNQNQGVTWNFPTGDSGSLKFKIRLENAKSRAQICLTDRWFNPTDATVPEFANYHIELDSTQLTVGKVHTLEISWDKVTANSPATARIDGESIPGNFPALQDSCPNGVSYLHLYNPASETDMAGFSIFETHAVIK